MRSITTLLCLIAAVTLCSTAYAQQQQADTTVPHIHNTVTPDFTDMGVGALISAGRYRLSNGQFEALIVTPIENALYSPSETFNAPKPDPCMPPVHCGWDAPPPASSDWNALDSNLRRALANTSSAVKAQIKAKIQSVWTTSRPVAYPAEPPALTCEFIGLNSPSATPSPTGKFTSVVLEKIPSGAANPQVVRIRLIYQP